ncbi:LLM class flavin-dependent oxidoreductase [Agromyces aerolatus]|uniref:LLM class flavin-dependent oxidoreductase n=1 Tax=Agromyces sp. LY-1074 TaxID=3074080 RepID=UPI002854E3CB|nr:MULTISPECIES: LLM class flavin-dependent oxidoreductase [unclassified Agromyces]MDR5698332.1 LLM class flavin-dependent oxidoreductase [Agromyces sp. LY-1074]MDR5704626.1 LLM class flavin-dependent oxidoreductase [Agromyces sp. LY-1358]
MSAAETPHGAGARPVEIGIGLQSDQPPGRYAELATLAESVGIDVVSVFSDLLFQPPIGALLEMARATERVRLGAAGWNPFTLHPYEIAGQLALLDATSEGRAYLGLVKGTWLDAIGVAQPKPVAHLREAAGHIYALLAGDGAGYEGEYFPLKPGITLRYPVLRARPPLLLGSWGPLGIALAGRIADELKLGGAANPDLVPVVRERLRVGTDRVGRSVDDVRIVFGAVTVVDHDGEAARSVARREVAMYLDAIAELDPTVDVPAELMAEVRAKLAEHDHEAAGAVVPDDLLDRFCFSGTPAQVAAQAQRLIDAGVGRVEFGTPQGLRDVAEGVELIGREVVPLLRRERA